MKKLQVINKYNNPVNILHFQGKNINILPKTVLVIANNAVLNKLDSRLTILTVFTNKQKAILAQQLEKNNIPYINALPNDYDLHQEWKMPNKIKFFIDKLEKINTEFTLILDAYDVLICSFDKLIEKFLKQKYHILYNSTYNNFPDEDIDYIKNRESYDDFMLYMNAGCCIGYTKDLLRFYKECYEYINIENELNSEQKVIRTCFAKYSNDDNQNFVWIDFKHDIFNSMGCTRVNYNYSENKLTITDNLDVKKLDDLKKQLKMS